MTALRTRPKLTEARMFAVEISEPPSVNGAYFNKPHGQGRGMVRAVKKWKDDTAWLIALRVNAGDAIKVPYTVELRLPEKMRGDADNRIKIALDALVQSGRVPDDRHAKRVTATKTPGQPQGTAWLYVREAA